jgi:hypothetical protein
MNKPLSYHRKMAVVVFGEDSAAVKFLDQKIADAPHGENELVFIHESQMVHLLIQLHLDAQRSPTAQDGS